MNGKFEPTFESLHGYEVPEWFRNAKFGIWSHWGPQSVPMFGDWYARNMYIEGTPQYEYHLRHYGHPSKFGYKDICALWKAEKFDPDALIARYWKAGARYLMTQGTHHDHFFNYGSAINRMNSVNVGPHKDILALWKAAADKYSMPFGISEHLGASFSWWRVNKGCDKFGPYAGVPYDGTDPAYRDFYHANEEHGTDNPLDSSPWYTDNPQFHAYWLRCVKEMIDRFQPEILYTDGSLPFGGHWMDGPAQISSDAYAEGLQAVAHLYNTSIESMAPIRLSICRRTAARKSSRWAYWILKRASCPASCRIPGTRIPVSATGSMMFGIPTNTRSRLSKCWWISSARTA